MKTPKTYIKTFFKNCILKKKLPQNFLYQCQEPPWKNAKNHGKHKGNCCKLIIFSSKVINFKHFAQTSTITKLFVKVQIWLVQSLGFKVRSTRLSTINSNPPFAYVILSIWYSPLPFWLYSFAIVSSYCFTSEIQELMFLSQTLTTSWHLIQFPVAYLGRPFR